MATDSAVLDGPTTRRRIVLAGQSIGAIADLVGIQPSTLSHALAGKPISGPVLGRIAEALGCKPVDLVQDEPVAS